MYHVYKLRFGECVYVGCTNNIKRRKDQHNENARKKKGKLGTFLFSNRIILTEGDFQIVFSDPDRAKALDKEKTEAVRAENEGFVLLNDNYSRDCTRKGKNLGNSAKEWVIVDCREHTASSVSDLRQYAISNGMDYKLLQRTGNGGICGGRYAALRKEDWEKLGEEKRAEYTSGLYIENRGKNAQNARIGKTAKSYMVRFPDGHEEMVRNLDAFARDHSLTSGTLHATYTKKKPTKGYQVIGRI